MKKITLLLTLFSCIISLFDQDFQPVRIACIGNSVTYGVGIKNRFQNCYPGILQLWLGAKYDIRNFGMSARTLLQKGDYLYMRECAFSDAKEFMPDIVTIQLGTNDCKPHNWIYDKDFKKDSEKMVNIFQTLPAKPDIYLCLSVPATKAKSSINDSIIVNGIIPVIKKVAKKSTYH